MLKENCGVVAAFAYNKEVSYLIFNSLLSLQHRGQESFGIATYYEGNIYLVKKLGLVVNSLTKEDLAYLKGNIGIGHVRYSTTGKTSLEDAQPFLLKENTLQLASCFNGNLVNYIQLRHILNKEGYKFIGRGDGEILTAFIFNKYKEYKDIEKTLIEVTEYIEGAYSLVLINNYEELIAFRDPLGFRPLNIGFDSNGNILIASETVAHDINNFGKIETVRPGEMIIINKSGIERKIISKSNKKAYCMFEFVYFSRPDSIFEGKCVYEVRYNLGKELARTYKTDAEIIIPIPDTSRPVAEAISQETGLPVVEGLIKNRYIGRTFIMPTQDERDKNVKMKLNVIKSLVKDKKVLLVDDSIVRGTTIKRIIEMIRKAGAKKVEVWISCPPIISPCFYGIDIAIHGELIASKKSVEEIAKEIGADKLCYQTLEGLKKAIGLGNDICISCLTGKYPTKLAQKLADELKDKEIKERYWEIETVKI